MATSRVNRATGAKAPQPGDMTAVRKAALEEQHAEEQAARAAELSMLAETDTWEKQNTVVDYTGADTPLPEVKPVEDDANPVREIIIKYPIEQMAFGREVIKEAELDGNGNVLVPAVLGNIRYFDFEEGRRYRVPRPLADHLDERGYVFH